MTVHATQRTRLIPELSPHAELALLARSLYRAGYDDCDVGHMTYRQPDDTFLALPHQLGWDEVCASDIIRIDIEGTRLEGDWNVSPPIVLHLEFHRARPGCAVTVHQHPRFATIWSAVGRIPPAYDQRGAIFADDELTIYDDYEGGVERLDAARAAVAGIGNANCALLRNHGVFVVGDSIAQCYGRAISLEWRCRQAWFVEAVGGGKAVPEHGQRAILEQFSKWNNVSPTLWNWAVRREIRTDPDVLS
jgi:ribulose-5-phosphate 4-epimerase/fuculose-1-phosphate aldolase